jgi:anterior pharynx defective protein 1
MSLFLMGALYSLAFGMILSSIMVVAIEGYHTRNWLHIAYAPIVHFAAALVVRAAGTRCSSTPSARAAVT